MRFFTIFLLVAMAFAQDDPESTTAATTAVVESTTVAETIDVGTGTVVSANRFNNTGDNFRILATKC